MIFVLIAFLCVAPEMFAAAKDRVEELTWFEVSRDVRVSICYGVRKCCDAFWNAHKVVDAEYGYFSDRLQAEVARVTADQNSGTTACRSDFLDVALRQCVEDLSMDNHRVLIVIPWGSSRDDCLQGIAPLSFEGRFVWHVGTATDFIASAFVPGAVRILLKNTTIFEGFPEQCDDAREKPTWLKPSTLLPHYEI